MECCDPRELFLYPRYFGGEIKRRVRDDQRDSFRWRVYADKARVFCREMLWRLWGTKRDQVELVLMLDETEDQAEKERLLSLLKRHKRERWGA